MRFFFFLMNDWGNNFLLTINRQQNSLSTKLWCNSILLSWQITTRPSKLFALLKLKKGLIPWQVLEWELRAWMSRKLFPLHWLKSNYFTLWFHLNSNYFICFLLFWLTRTKISFTLRRIMLQRKMTWFS